MGIVLLQLVFIYIGFLSNIWVDRRLFRPNIENREKIKFYSHTFDNTKQLRYNSYKKQNECYTSNTKNPNVCEYGWDTENKKDVNKLSWMVGGEYTVLQVFNYYFVHFTFPIIIAIFVVYIARDPEFLC
jgi:hypothetical protein